MNIVIVPLIGPQEDAWLSPEVVSMSSLDNFCRLFLPPPDSETRKQARLYSDSERDDGAVEGIGGDQQVVADDWHPNGFLAVDSAGEALRRIGKFILRTIVSKSVPGGGGPEAKLLKLWARLFVSRGLIPTVRRVDMVVAACAGEAGESGGQTAIELTTALNGQCDAVIAFEDNGSRFRLRAQVAPSTAVTELYRSGHLSVLQEQLQATWHWDRDAGKHCKWLGIDPPDVTSRNQSMVGAALAFETCVTLCDRHVGSSLCNNVLRRPKERARWPRSENDIFKDRWAPKWLASLEFMLRAWKSAASEVGNTQGRSLVIWTAVDVSQWNELGWHFIARAEHFLSEALAGHVEIKVCSNPSKESPAGRKANQEMHPRYLIACTRAIQIDRGFDVVEETRDEDLEHSYTEITSRPLSAARYVRERWTEKEMTVLPRSSAPPLNWTQSMTNW